MSNYQTGFGNHVASEAVPGALPVGRNSPQKPPFGLYAEQFSTTAFTAPRSANRRSWLYRMRPTAEHAPYEPLAGFDNLRTAPFTDPVTPNRLRWDPLTPGSGDWLEGLVTYGGIVDGMSSARMFDGWSTPVITMTAVPPWQGPPPRTWFVRTGWKLHSLIMPSEAPVGAPRPITGRPTL